MPHRNQTASDDLPSNKSFATKNAAPSNDVGFEFVSRLGEGSYGSVLLCRVRSSDSPPTGEQKHVAVKRFKWAHTDEMGLRVAMREVRLLRSLNHPLIIRLERAFSSHSGRLYAVFPFIEGGCGQRVLKACYPDGLPPAFLKSFAWQLCVAVRYLHGQKVPVLHRDIKPSNVLLSPDGTIRLCDFGFARQVMPYGGSAGPNDLDDNLTPYVQTRPYRAPEVLLGQPYGESADIWSIGATIAEMATGKPLLPGTSSLDQLWRILGAVPGPRPAALEQALDTLSRLDPAKLSEQVPLELLRPSHLPGPPLRQRLAHLEPQLVDWVEACLRLHPEQRPSADALLRMPWFDDVPQLFAGNDTLTRLFEDEAAIGAAAAAAAAAAATVASSAEHGASSWPQSSAAVAAQRTLAVSGASKGSRGPVAPAAAPAARSAPSTTATAVPAPRAHDGVVRDADLGASYAPGAGAGAGASVVPDSGPVGFKQAAEGNPLHAEETLRPAEKTLRLLEARGLDAQLEDISPVAPARRRGVASMPWHPAGVSPAWDGDGFYEGAEMGLEDEEEDTLTGFRASARLSMAPPARTPSASLRRRRSSPGAATGGRDSGGGGAAAATRRAHRHPALPRKASYGILGEDGAAAGLAPGSAVAGVATAEGAVGGERGRARELPAGPYRAAGGTGLVRVTMPPAAFNTTPSGAMLRSVSAMELGVQVAHAAPAQAKERDHLALSQRGYTPGVRGPSTATVATAATAFLTPVHECPPYGAGPSSQGPSAPSGAARSTATDVFPTQAGPIVTSDPWDLVAATVAAAAAAAAAARAPAQPGRSPSAALLHSDDSGSEDELDCLLPDAAGQARDEPEEEEEGGVSLGPFAAGDGLRSGDGRTVLPAAVPGRTTMLGYVYAADGGARRMISTLAFVPYTPGAPAVVAEDAAARAAAQLGPKLQAGAAAAAQAARPVLPTGGGRRRTVGNAAFWQQQQQLEEQNPRLSPRPSSSLATSSSSLPALRPSLSDDDAGVRVTGDEDIVPLPLLPPPLPLQPPAQPPPGPELHAQQCLKGNGGTTSEVLWLSAMSSLGNAAAAATPTAAAGSAALSTPGGSSGRGQCSASMYGSTSMYGYGTSSRADECNEWSDGTSTWRSSGREATQAKKQLQQPQQPVLRKQQVAAQALPEGSTGYGGGEGLRGLPYNRSYLQDAEDCRLELGWVGARAASDGKEPSDCSGGGGGGTGVLGRGVGLRPARQHPSSGGFSCGLRAVLASVAARCVGLASCARPHVRGDLDD